MRSTRWIDEIIIDLKNMGLREQVLKTKSGIDKKNNKPHTKPMLNTKREKQIIMSKECLRAQEIKEC